MDSRFLIAIDRRDYGNLTLRRAVDAIRASQTVNTVAERRYKFQYIRRLHGTCQGSGPGRGIVRVLAALTIAVGMGVLAAWGIIEGRSQAAREAGGRGERGGGVTREGTCTGPLAREASRAAWLLPSIIPQAARTPIPTAMVSATRIRTIPRPVPSLGTSRAVA